MEPKFEYNGLEVAIIGISLQFPESDNYLKYWDNLRAGKEMITHYSVEELMARGVPDSDIYNKDYVRSFGAIENKDCFDSAFFNYSPAEASTMDPQIRVFHQLCWKALEDAGYGDPEDKKKIGLFAGASVNDNWKIYTQARGDAAQISSFHRNILSNRSSICSLISYKLDLRGPSVYIDTACSTSMTAVHVACRSLLTQECSIAIAGGISINTEKKKGYVYQEGMIFSEDGHCRTFDARSTGTVGGEGAGVIVLKRLKEAIRDADHIYAVIRSTAINNDGNRKVGYTAPSVNGQKECIVTALRLAGIEARSIGYVEAHGTATKLGDSIEIGALNEAFRTDRDLEFCSIGSVKSNLGHLEAASGIAGLIKTALSLHYRQLPASLHYSKPNPEIDFSGGPFRVNSELKEWKSRGAYPLRAGVNSFGVGGTNVHALLEEAPKAEEYPSAKKYKLLTVSARTPGALTRYLSNLKVFLLTGNEVNLDDLAYTLQVGRKPFGHRKAIVYKNKEELIRLIDANNPGEPYTNPGGGPPPVVFVFPGQRCRYEEVGNELYLQEPWFRAEMDKGLALLAGLTGEDRRNGLNPTAPAGKPAISENRYVQPITFLFEYALARLMIAYGVQPTYLMGHGPGEYVSACISGVFRIEDALRLIIKHPVLTGHLGEEMSINAFRDELAKTTFNKPLYPWISDTAGRFITEREAVSPEYWIKQMVTSDRFPEGVKELLSPGNNLVVLVLGSGGGLIDQLKQQIEDKPIRGFVDMHSCSSPNNDSLRDFTERLGQLWTLGVKINWHAYYTGERRRRVSLPTYSFDCTRYPAEVNPFDEAFFSKLNLTPSRNEGLKDRIYYPIWTNTPLLPVSNNLQKRKVLFFSTNDEFAGLVKAGLCKNGDEVIEICIGSDYKKCPEGRYFVAPDSPENIKRLLRELLKETGDTIDILYSWSAHRLPGRLPLNRESGALHLVYFAIAGIVKEFSNYNTTGSRIILLTNTLHQVAGNETIHYSQSPALGLVNIIPQEYSIACRNVDIDLTEDAKRLAASLVWELSPVIFNERIVALRSGRRWVREYRRNSVQPSVPKGRSVIKKEGVYLITGGSGNIGLVLAKYLISRYDAKVVLVGGLLRELEALSGNVICFSADIADEVSLSDAVARIRTKFGNIEGVIHSAGNINGTSFESMEDLSSHNMLMELSPLIAGIENLYSVFKDQQPDFVWIASGPAPVSGGLAVGSYAAVNLYMEHFITGRCKDLPHWKVVGFSEMAFTEEETEAKDRPVGSGLLPAEITALFEWSLYVEGVPILYETTGDPGSRPSWGYDRKGEGEIFDLSRHPPVGGSIFGQETTYLSPRTELERQLTGIWQEVLGIERIGIDDNFFERGGHSVLITKIAAKLLKMSGIKIGLRTIFEAPTIKQLAAVIADRIGESGIDVPFFLDEELVPAVRENGDPVYEITPQQKKEFARFLVIGEYGYNICMNLEIEDLNPAIMEQVFETIFRRHESLRTTFLRVNGEMKQYIHEDRPPGFFIEYTDVRGQEQKQEIAMNIYRQLPEMPLNFETGPLIIAKVIRFSGNTSYLLVAVHHVHSDHHSLQLLKREIEILYESYQSGRDNPLAAIRIQYKDYASWVHRFQQGKRWEQNAASYRKKIMDNVRSSRSYQVQSTYRKELEDDLINKLHKKNIGDYSFAFGTLVNLKPDPGGSYTTYLDEDLLSGLKKLAVESKASLFTTLAAIFSIALSRLNKDANIRMYIPISTRAIEEFQDIVGWLTGELILCIRVEEGGRLKDLIKTVTATVLEDSDCRFYPYEQLMYDLDLPLAVLSPVCLNFISSVQTAIGDPASFHGSQGDGHFNFKCTITEYSNGVCLASEYNRTVYTGFQIEEMIKEYLSLLRTEIAEKDHAIVVV